MAVFAASNLFMYSANTSSRQASHAEAFEGARISLDFLITQLNMAHGFRYTTYRNTEILQRLTLFTETDEGEHTFIFTYDRLAERLNFGGSSNYPFTYRVQELASGIESVDVHYDEDNGFMYFTVISSTGGFSVTGGVDVRYKEIR
jgi:hypothetical protein